MIRLLFLLAALLPATAVAQPVRVGPLDVRNGLAEIAAGGAGAQATARANLGLGSLATQSAGAVSITGGSIAGAALGGGTVLVPGGITALSLASRFGQLHSVRDYGAVGDGVANDFAALAATPTPAWLPPGLYYTGASITSVHGNYRGGITGGRLETLEGGVVRLGPRNLWYLDAPITGGGIGYSEASSATAFDYDDSGQFLNGLVRISGATTLGQPATGYQGNPAAAAIYLNYSNINSGWNQATDSNDGRTGTSAVRVRVNNSGAGDVGAYNAIGYANGAARAGATSFLANPATVLYSGSNTAAANGVYLDTLEFAVSDAGFDAAAAGAVWTFNRTNATGALGAFWAGLRLQALALSGGGKPLDAFLSIAGPSVIGLDLSAAQFYALDGVTPTNAAIALAMGQRIYGNASNAGSGHFPNSTVLGTSWMSFEAGTGWNFVVGSAPVLQIAPQGIIAKALYLTTPDTPASSTSPCTQGHIVQDPGYIYVCVATNQWKRAALSSW